MQYHRWGELIRFQDLNDNFRLTNKDLFEFLPLRHYYTKKGQLKKNDQTYKKYDRGL